MGGLGAILLQFLFRLGFGLCVAMGITPSRLVTSGFFRVHLYVALGVHTLAALTVWSLRPPPPRVSWIGTTAVLAAALAYAGSVCWLYESKRVGMALLWIIGLLSLAAAWMAMGWPVGMTAAAAAVNGLDAILAGLVLGLTLAAMLLGHWYLNTPTMDLVPLRRLLRVLGGALLARALFCSQGVLALAQTSADVTSSLLIFVAFRWLAGLLLPGVLVAMAWQTLKIPNTQSATGILYASVVLVFLGELVSQLLSANLSIPV